MNRRTVVPPEFRQPEKYTATSEVPTYKVTRSVLDLVIHTGSTSSVDHSEGDKRRPVLSVVSDRSKFRSPMSGVREILLTMA